MPSGRRTPWSLRTGLLALTALSCVVALGLAEIATRLLLPEPWYLEPGERVKPDLPKFRVGKRLVALREPLPTTAPATAYRILFLGDSFTYGVGVDADQTFVGQIEARLNQTPPREDFREYVAFNGGIPGSRTQAWTRLYAAAQTTFLPHLVVAVFFLRDGQAAAGSIPTIQEMKESLRELQSSSALFKHSHLYRQLFQQRWINEVGKTYLSTMAAGYTGSEIQTREWRRAQQNVLWLRDRASERGAEFALVIFPVLFNLRGDYPMQEVVDEIERFARADHIRVLSLLAAFRGHSAPDLWVSRFDQHPNIRGHEIAAAAIYPLIEELISEKRTSLPTDARRE